MEHPLRIAEIEVSQAAADERIVGLFRYDSENGGRKGPTLLMVADIGSTIYAYEQLLDALNAAAEQTRTLLSGTGVDPMARFEKMVERLNEAVADFVEREPSELGWHRVNLFILEVMEGRVCVAGVGQLSNVFLQKQPDGTFRSFDLLGSLDTPNEIDPRKPFASILCGDLRPGDVLFVGTNNFERLRGELGIAARLKTLPPVTAALEIRQDLEKRNIPDDFAAVVISQVAGSSRAEEIAPISDTKSTTSIEKMHSEEKKTEEILAPSISPPKPALSLVSLFARAKDFMKKKAKSPFAKGSSAKNPVTLASLRGMSAGHGNVMSTDKRRTWLAGIAILLILGGGGGWFWSRQKFKAEQQLWNTVFDDATDKKTRAESDLVYGNEDQTHELIRLATEELNGLDEKTPERKAAKDGLSKDLNDLAVKLKRELKVTPTELVTATLGAADGTFSAPAVRDGSVYLADAAGNSLVEVNTATKESKRHPLPEGTARIVSAYNGTSAVYLMTEAGKILSYNPADGTTTAVTWTSKASSTQALVLYGKRFYVLDTVGNMVWRYSPISGGIGQESAYLKQNSTPLTDAVGLAIDSEVYVGWKNGGLKRYLSGAEESWAPVAVDPPLQNISSIWTASETDRLVVADPVNKRIVVYRKDGRLVAQIKADAWTGPTAVSGDDKAKKLYVVDGNKLWQVDLP